MPAVNVHFVNQQISLIAKLLSGVTLLILIFTVLGFWNTYIIHIPKTDAFSAHFHWHFAFALAWLIFVGVQPQLLKSQKHVHKILGYGSIALMVALILSIVLVAQQLAEMRLAINPGYLYGPLQSIVLILAPYILALVFRKAPEIHARYMLATLFPFVEPGLGRAMAIYGSFPLEHLSMALFLIIDMLIIAAILLDKGFNKQAVLRNPLTAILLITLVLQVLKPIVIGTETWTAVSALI